MQDDILLTRYIQDGSEAAFSQLVTRHLPLVYRACLRETGSAAQAEDAAQVVFLLLARKAKSLQDRSSLTGWLYQTAVFVAKNVHKQEARRKLREHSVMQEAVDVEAAPRPNWDTVEPLLNAALSALKSADREAVLLRFVEGHTLAETGDLLGVTEDAARMRVTRALEKLRRYLTAHGAAVTGVLLTALLTTEAARPVPAQAAATITQGTLQAISTGPVPNVLLLSKGVSHTMKIIKIKYAAVAAVLLLASASVPSLVHALSPQKASMIKASIGSVANTPVPDDSATASPQWVIPGDFTLRYTVSKTDIRPLAVREASQKSMYPALVNELYEQAHGGRHPAPGETIAPEILEQAEANSKKQPDFSTRPMTLTLAQHADKFLYLLMSRQLPPVDWRTDGVPAKLVLVDSKNSLYHQFIENGEFTVTSGLNGRALDFMPVFCSDLAAFPLMKDLKRLPNGDYQGAVLDPGNTVGPNSNSYYDPTTLIRVAYADGKPRITQIIRRDPDGTISRHMEITDWVLFKGVWIPSKARYTFSYFLETGERSPSFYLEWTLIDAKEAADAHQFDLTTYLHKGDHVVQTGLH